MLAKLFSLFFLLMPVCLVQAQESAEYVNAFGGVDNYQDSSKIAKTDAQDAMNVLTDNGKLMKRPGSVAMTTLFAGQPIYTLGEYISPSNIRYLIAQASSTVYASDLGPAGFVVIATVTANYPLDFVSAYGKVYFSNGIDTPFSWDGTTTVWISSIPKCAQLEFADERIYCANAPNFKSTMYASRFGDATDWTIPAISPLPADAPNSFTFNRNDGDQILCMKVTPWGKFIGKKNSSYILKGQDNEHYYKGIVSPTVGCLDGRSVQMVDGDLVWLAQDYTIYSWDGNSAPKPASREIDAYVKSVRQAVAQQNSYNTSTQYDWRAGTVTWNGSRPGLDIETWPGSVKPSTWSHINDEAAHWNLGSLTNIDSTTVYGSIILSSNLGPLLYDTFTDITKWTFGIGSNYYSVSNNKLKYAGSPAGTYTGSIFTSTDSFNYGNSKVDLSVEGVYLSGGGTAPSSHKQPILKYIFVTDTTTFSIANGYGFVMDCSEWTNYYIRLVKYTNGSETVLASKTLNNPVFTGYIPLVCTNLSITISTYGYIVADADGTNCDISYTDSNFVQSLSVGKIIYNSVYKDEAFVSRGNTDNPAYISNLYNFGAYTQNGYWESTIYDTSFSTPVGGAYYFTNYVPSGSTLTYQVAQSTASDGSGFGSWVTISTTTSGEYHIPFTKRYWKENIILNTSYSTNTPRVDITSITATSAGTYYSKPQYIGTSITSWDLFSADQQVSDVRLSTFAIRSSLTPFGILDVSPAWTTQVNGSVPTISTGSYVQFKFDLNPVTSTGTLQVDGVSIAWREGESRPLASLYDDHRYILCANTTVGTNINDLCLVWQKNKKWVPFSGQSWGALSRFNNYPIAGDGSTGSKIWKILDPTYLNDDGVAINAYWVSKDFDYDKPNQIKVPMKIWFEADALPTSYLSVGFAADKGSIYTSTTVDLAQSAYLNTNVSSIFDGFALGKYFKFKFSDNTLNSNFKLNAYSVYYDSKPLGQE